MPATVLNVLFEHASGYALFRVKECEEIEALAPEVEESVADVSRFSSIVKLVAFSPFKSGTNALDNMNACSEGVLHEDLRLFLETHVPKPSKKQKSILGIGDAKMGGAMADELGLAPQHTGVVPEVLRGIRAHFGKLVKGLTEATAAKAQLGLGHSYSRSKVKFNVNRSDNMIIQSIALLDQLDKDVNTFSMRIREWYSYHFPELVKIVPENHMFARVVKYIMNRKEFNEGMLPALEEIVMDSAKARAIWDASRASMGMDIAPIDLINIERFAVRVIDLSDYRKSLHTYLRNKMEAVAPNLASLIGDQVGARLISHAGSLTNLAKYPASTVQILGAEKALFRALKTKGNTPKYGLIFHSTFIGRAGQKNKGRISRYLANKCSIASRIDCFTETPSSVFGEALKQQVEDRLKFYETGDAPDKNIDVMKKAIADAEVVAAEALRVEKKKKKKEAKAGDAPAPMETTPAAEATPAPAAEASLAVNNGNGVAEKKKKKKDKKDKLEVSSADSGLDSTTEAFESLVDTTLNTTSEEPTKEKKKKKRTKSEAEPMEVSEAVAAVTPEPVKKKKKKAAAADTTLDSTLDTTAGEAPTSEKKKKKKKAAA